MEVLRVEGLSKSFGGFEVLQEVSFCVEAGEEIAIIGPNGAGKTTLINVLNGVLPCSAGQIYVCRQRTTNAPPYRCCRLGISRSFQLNTLSFNIPLLDNVLLASQGTQLSWFQMLRSISQKSFLAKAQDLLEVVGLWEKRQVPPRNLSYGEQRLVEIVLTLASGSKLLLLDEPSCGLSAAEVNQLLNIFDKLPRDIALLFSAHDMGLVFSLASRVIVLHHGRLIAEGTPEEVRADSRVREIYLGGGQ